MTSRARVETDLAIDGIRLAVVRRVEGGPSIAMLWSQPNMEVLAPATEVSPSAWLPLTDDDARAIYEALGEHYGHTGTDTRALRADYDAERRRVDKFIDMLIRPHL